MLGQLSTSVKPEFYSGRVYGEQTDRGTQNASGHYRAVRPEKAHDLLTSIPAERQSAQIEVSVATTHGGVMRDLETLDEA